MYARATTSKGNPDQVDEATAIVRDSVLPVAKQQMGFAGYLLLADRTTGKAITITLWETEADREASGEGSEYYGQVMGTVAPMLTAEPMVEDFEILVQA